ncbi:hypothetical protein AJ79_00819 [Helicocarpus griseus UAMH5409]|uniref:SGNH hydrolase-type esterase domain-containing protein n=1 Tax=Helicocarpus griseus UAMH5409 TaxID=1447875 RepID=A0A2B7Y9P8_9EURO|nr:hypothetical protein AJ79_00819 [Helicocarpus griseus UAMH5409]
MHTVWHRLSILFFLPGQTIALPPFASLNTQNTATKVTPLFPREAEVERDSFDSSDLSWIKKLTAIGDSYSAGIGAGDRLGSVTGAFDSQSDWSCSRYDQAYPNLINNDARLGDPGARKFQFKSCSGATTEDVLEKQIPSLDKDQQAIILSIGGNDVELSNVLNQCIYQWAVINQEQVALAKATALDRMFEWATGFDWEALGRGCAKQLDHTRSLIEGEAFSSNVDKVLEAAKTKLAKDGKIYFTGYGKFFGEKMSPECDDVSWSTWIYKTYNIFQPEAKLTVENRRRMNELVDSVNNKLREAAERAGSSVTFIDYDKYIGEFGGRYCEPGVDESTNTSNSRPLLMFYKLNTRDPMGETPWKRSKDNPLPETFSGSLDTLAEITLLLDPDAKLIHDNQIEGETASEVFHSRLKAIEGAQAGEGSELEARNLLPDG